MEIDSFVDSKSDEIKKIEFESHLAWWNLATKGDETYADELQNAKIALRKLFSSSKDFSYLVSQPVQPDPFLNRQLTLLLNSYRENQIPEDLIKEISILETDIESIYTNFRPIVNGKEISNNDLKKILSDSLDVNERQEAWEASKAIGEIVEPMVLRLIDLRNQSAKLAGFDNYYSMSLELQELDETRLFSILEELEKATNPVWKKYKQDLDLNLSSRFGIDRHDLRPWHYQDPFFQEAPKLNLNFDIFYKDKNIVEISRTFFKDIALPVEDVLERSDLFERNNKSQHAFCSCLDRNQDIRVLCNIRENEYWMGTQLHELGHAVYDKYIDPNLPFLLRTPSHISTTEASAMLFGRFSKDAAFLEKYVGIDKKEAKDTAGLGIKQNAANLLVFARWALVMIHFERNMYQNKRVNLNELWWDCVKRFQDVNIGSERNKPDWASKLHLACAPAYYQNYVIGEMTASQLFYHIKDLLKKSNEEFCGSPKVGEFLKTRFYCLGAQYPWEQTIYQATKEDLNPKYFSLDVEKCV